MADSNSKPRGRARQIKSANVASSSAIAVPGMPLGIQSHQVQESIASAPVVPPPTPALRFHTSTPIASPSGGSSLYDDSISSISSCDTGLSTATRETGAVTIYKNFNKSGTRGEKLPVVTNYVAMEKRPNFTIKQYRVDFYPTEDHTFLKKQLLAIHTDKLAPYIFDGAMLYKTQKIEQQHLELVAKSSSQDYKVKLRQVGEIRMDDQAFLQFYNTVFRKCLNLMELEELGRNFYNEKAKILVPGAFLELWPGYITAIRHHDSGLLLCAEVTHKVLRTTNVLDIIKNMLARNSDLRRGQEAIRNELLGQIVLTHYNRKTYRIDEIDFDSTPLATFSVKASDGTLKDVSYKEYYQNRYGIDIPDTEMQQPLLVSHPRKKDVNKGMKTNIYLIPSLSNLTGLSEDQRKDFRLMQQLAEHLHMDPKKRKQKLDEFMNVLKTNETVCKEFGNWDIEFNPEFLQATARILPQEEIQLAPKSGGVALFRPDHVADWTNVLKRNFMLTRVALTDWVMYIPTEQKAKSSRFLEGLREQAGLLGMQVVNPLKTFFYESRSRCNEQELIKPLRDFKNVKFVVFILPNNQLQRYCQVKKLFVLRYGIAIQCFVAKNLDSKNFNSIMSKVAIQVNAKLGGIPWSIKVPFNKSAMILGFDVYHCAERKLESVGALVATVTPNLGRYFSVVSFHKDKSELSRNMCNDTKKCLEAFREENGYYPDRILLFRDGVGEGQLKFVVEHEVKMMQAGINEVYAGETLPKLSFIVVTKKINSRYLAVKSGGICNPPPGTVLDEVITLPGRYDYFMVSQSVRQGTVSPTNYNVIFQNVPVNPDAMQQLTFKLCHLYFNWSGTVAVPAPCQFAHKLAYLTGVALSDNAPEPLNNVLWYL